MSTNLLLNGDFTSPVVASNTYITFESFTTAQKNSLIWDASNSLFRMINGVSSFEYPTPVGSIQNTTQFANFQLGGLIKQSVNITQKGTYQINLKYVARVGYLFYPLEIRFGGILRGTITTSVSTWTSYTITFDISSTGSQELLFKGPTTGGDLNIAIGNVSLTLIQAVSTIQNSVKWENNRFLCFGRDTTNRIIYGNDGINWTSSPSSQSIFTTAAYCGVSNFIQPHMITFPSNMTLTGNLVSTDNGISWNTFDSRPAPKALGWNGTNYIYGSVSSNPTYIMTDICSNFVALPPPFGTDITTVNIIKWNGRQWLMGTTSQSTNQVMMSYCGYNWFPTTVSSFAEANYPCNGIAWNNTLWVVSGLTFFGTYLLYSGDGVNWQQASTTLGGGPVEWNGSYFICGGTGTGSATNISKSTDGINWSSQNIGNFGIVQGIAQNGNLWVITTNSTTTTGIFISNDGNNWRGVGGIPSTYSHTGVVWNGIAFIVNTTTNIIRQSYDGNNWTSVSTSFQSGNQLIWTNPNAGQMNILQPTLIGGVGTYTTMAYSLDGIYYISLGNNIFSTACNAIAWNGSIWVAGGEGTNTLAYSNNGILWTGVGTAIFSVACYGVTWNGTIWLATGSGGNTFATSTDGKKWMGLNTNIIDISAISTDWNGTAWVAVGNGTNNTIAYSSSVNATANTWVGLGKTSFTNTGYGIRWMANRWVAVGKGSNTFVFSNSVIPSNNWVSSSSGVFSNSANNLFWNGNIAVAVGSGPSGNTIATSTDGMSWRGIGNTALATAGYGVYWNTQRWVAGGSGANSVVYSYNGNIWYNGITNINMLSTVNCVSSNSKMGPIVVNGSIYLNTGDSLVVTTPSVVDSGLSSDTAISINMNLP